jgi:CRP/FNR family transcriptional regulator, cyclic AMP receptor protein
LRLKAQREFIDVRHHLDLLEGEVGIQEHGRSIYTAGPGEILGEMAMIDAQGRTASALALSPCRLAVVDEKQFLFMVQETPNFALEG